MTERVGVTVSRAVAQKIVDRYGTEGRSSEIAFWERPLAAALFAFRSFDSHEQPTRSPDLRSLLTRDPHFGPLLFIAVRTSPTEAEIVDFETHEDASSPQDSTEPDH